MTPRTFRFNTSVHPFYLEVAVAYEDTKGRDGLKASGYRWMPLDRTWRFYSDDVTALRKKVISRLRFGYRLASQGGNEPHSVAEQAAHFALPLPVPVSLSDTYTTAEDEGVNRDDRADMAWTIDLVGQTAEGVRDWQLTNVTLTPEGQALYETRVSQKRAVAPQPMEA